ncbi:MAG: GTPase HflX [Actinomycetaceae bacterium]|nr:GTPase HflX [Arcanobacterium sp.]MDD7504840.1 GTPase HflX [Actinomycetaceae bacterium]
MAANMETQGGYGILIHRLEEITISTHTSHDGSSAPDNATANTSDEERGHEESRPALEIHSHAGTALQADPAYDGSWAGGEFEREVRSRLRRVGGIGSERHEEDADVEYRQLRLEKVVLVGLWVDGDARSAEDSLRELAALAETAGSEVLDGLIQRRALPDPATFLGSGKARELRDIVDSVGADTVIVDSELAPSQRRALEDILNVKVIDRTALILDIFAQHAKSKEGKAQVELAQLEYLLPRLRGWGDSMSRQAGGRVAGGAGIGSRGPGETKIELDRRRIRTRMAKLRKDLKKMAPGRSARRAGRRRHGIPSVAVVGYTNAGKSSLMNVLTGADVMVENALFATLDPTVRQSLTPDGREYTLTDTVGFVRSLPTQLVEAFRSTLEEISEADLIVHVVDSSHDDPVGQIEAVYEVLRGIDRAMSIPELIVFSKTDIADPVTLVSLRSRYPESVAVSAVTGEGIDELKAAIADRLPRPSIWVNVTIPYTRGDLVALIHDRGEVQSETFSSQGTTLQGFVTRELAGYIESEGCEVTTGTEPRVMEESDGENARQATDLPQSMPPSHASAQA